MSRFMLFSMFFIGFTIMGFVGIWVTGIDDSEKWTDIFKGDGRDDI